jgi:hypothetical protein
MSASLHAAFRRSILRRSSDDPGVIPEIIEVLRGKQLVR